MIESDFDRLVRRAESLYSERKDAPIPAIYVVEPPIAAKPTELDEARALVISFFRAVPQVMLTMIAMQLLFAREAWRWLRQWKRISGSR
jgi:hypothetical protein